MWMEIFLGLVALFLALYFYVTKHFNRYKDLGVPYEKGYFPFGSYNFITGGHFDIQTEEIHKKFENEKYFGHFMFGKPMVGINDPDLLKMIQVKDFDHFVDRTSTETNKKFFAGGDLDKLWSKQLTSLGGEDWKEVRGAFTPIFTSGKMKNMMKFILQVSEDLTNEFEKKAEAGEEFELKSVFGKFSLDALASSAFGVNGESFTNDKSVFVKHAQRVFQTKFIDIIHLILRMVPGAHYVYEALKINSTAPEATRFFRDVITQSIRMRRESKERKNDLIDLMLDVMKDDEHKEEDKVEEEDQYEKDMKLNTSGKRKKQIDETLVVATAMVLLVAGYDTTGMTLSYLAYQLSKNEEVQGKLQEEIDEAFDEAGGKFPDYSVIQSLPYLDMVIHETLRFYTPIGANLRNAEKDYKLPDSNIVLKKGDGISYNARNLHSSPKYWSHPDEFYPEHFSKEEKANRNPYAFQAFGQGPRACIGMRFALLEAKIGVMAVMRRFSFAPGTKTKEPLEMDAQNQLAWPKGGLWANIRRREGVEE